jgi:hypothetical protein
MPRYRLRTLLIVVAMTYVLVSIGFAVWKHFTSYPPQITGSYER